MIKKTATFASMLFILAACWQEPESGPVDIKYDREACEYCRMIISDPRFATEIRQGRGKQVFKFDDIGDAMHWLNKAPWKETAETEIWVRDMNTGKKWLNARKVYFLAGQHSPMEYGYGAIAENRQGALEFEEMRKAVIAHGSTTRCDTPNHLADAEHLHDDASGNKQ
jgi:nitrous oxide reductase accessory protein NosL